MSTRVPKVESLIQQVVAAHLLTLMETDAARVTVTGVDVAPDIRSAIVWIGVLADDEAQAAALFSRVENFGRDLQQQLAKTITTKFVPRLSFKLDTGGQYAEHINRLLGNL